MSGRVALVALVVVASFVAPVAAQADLFKTPSGNIACGTGRNAGPDYAIVCTVLSEQNRRGQKLWATKSRGRVDVFRSMSNAAVDVQVLRYGDIYRGHGIRCASRKRGLTCRNRSHHGFRLARQHQSVF